MIPGKSGTFNFNYWQWFKHAVKELKISPSEAWCLDFVDLMYLTDQEDSNGTDLSIMLNFERTRNGAPKKWLLRN